MARYRHYDPHQTKMIAVSYGRQLLPGTFEHALSYLIDNEIDLGRFAARFRNDETGAPAYDPAVLLKVVLFAYSRGITSSRTMARACIENVIFIALACDQQPHFTTLAHFVATLGKEVEAIFRDVLMVCNAQGLIGKAMFAIDGCKLPSNASKEWSGTRADFERKAAKMERAVAHLVKAHAEQDAREALDPNEDRQREHEERTLATLRRNAGKLRSALATTRERRGAKGTPIKRNLTDAQSATLKTSHGVVQGYIGVAAVDGAHQVIVEAQAHGTPQEHDLLKPMVDGVRKQFAAIGEEGGADGAAYLADAGYHSERGLKALSEDRIDGYIADGNMRKRDPRYADKGVHKRASTAKTFLPRDFTFDRSNDTCVCPAGKTLKLNSANAIINGRKAIVFKGTAATCATCPLRSQCLRKPDVTAVRQVAFFEGAVQSKQPNPHCRAMREKIDSDQGRAMYAHRMGVIEPVFGHTQQRGLRRFTLRGQSKVDTQWKLFCIVHNVAKLQVYGKIAA
ncbi:MAG: IS1182 family transposase [Dokdonella sp.]|uniref:IS1182 family transposase n=1 Tax=Dokdonella sp. TaxID=2291710 RepID=UPI002BE41051|nr:IS1182 family transposase [Hyphomonadaceae bacterium]